jgi:hypothetical protein
MSSDPWRIRILDNGWKRATSPLQWLKSSLLGSDQLMWPGTTEPLLRKDQIMESKGSQDSYVQEAILSVSDNNGQIVELQIRINELLWSPSMVSLLLFSLDQREETLIRNFIDN